MTASVQSLGGTATGHLMCDRPASHVAKTPGQVAYETAQKLLPSMLWATWESADGVREAFEQAARAVLATQHYDETDQISWVRGEVPGNGQPG